MKSLTLNALFSAALALCAVPAFANVNSVGEANTEANTKENTPVYTYIYSPERAVGSLYHSFDLASSEIRQQAGAAAKSSSIADLDAGMGVLQQQFAYAIYVPKKHKLTMLDWRKLA